MSQSESESDLDAELRQHAATIHDQLPDAVDVPADEIEVEKTVGLTKPLLRLGVLRAGSQRPRRTPLSSPSI